MVRWSLSLRKFGAGKENSNYYGLLRFCRYNNLVIVSTAFGHNMALNQRGTYMIIRRPILLIML